MTAPLRVLFAGTPEIAVFSLEALCADPARGGVYEIVGVLTNPDRPSGRRREPVPSPVKRVAQRTDLPLLQPERLNGDARETVAALGPDLLVVVAFGTIFGPRFMDLFPKGGINLHPSLLPRHRGPSPLQAAILAGDDRTGVSVQYVAPEMDSGAILAQEEIGLPPTATVTALHDDLGRIGARLLVDVVTRIADGSAVAREQEHHRATYCRKIAKEDGAVTWRESAVELDRMVRAYTPWPGVRVRFRDQILQITRAVPLRGEAAVANAPEAVPGTVVGVDNRHGILVQTTDGLLAVTHLKPQTRKEMDYRSFLNGNRDVLGAVLSSV